MSTTNILAVMQRYERFRALMREAGYQERDMTERSGNQHTQRYWDHPQTLVIYDVAGRIGIPADNWRDCPAWEEWLDAGMTPPPF